MEQPPILLGQRTPNQTIEVCRSFAYKLNLANHGGPQYESADFFASRKLSCNAEEADAVSSMLFEECVQEIKTSVATFLTEMRSRSARRGGSREVA